MGSQGSKETTIVQNTAGNASATALSTGEILHITTVVLLAILTIRALIRDYNKHHQRRVQKEATKLSQQV